jgi:hypothetical protein
MFFLDIRRFDVVSNTFLCFFFGGSNLGYGYVGLSDVVLYIIYIWNC